MGTMCVQLHEHENAHKEIRPRHLHCAIMDVFECHGGMTSEWSNPVADDSDKRSLFVPLEFILKKSDRLRGGSARWVYYKSAVPADLGFLLDSPSSSKRPANFN